MYRNRLIFCFGLLLLVIATVSWGQYLGPVGSFSTPMQNQMRRVPTTGRVGMSAASPSAFTSHGCCTYRSRLNAKVPPSYLGDHLAPTGRSMARVSVGRAIYGGVGF